MRVFKIRKLYHKCHFSVPILVCHKKRKAWREHRNVRTTAEDSGTSATILSLSSLWSQCKPTLTLASAPVFSSIRILACPSLSRSCVTVHISIGSHYYNTTYSFFFHLPSTLYNLNSWYRHYIKHLYVCVCVCVYTVSGSVKASFVW